MDREKLERMAGSVRTGGKGTVRRKHKAVHKARRRRLQRAVFVGSGRRSELGGGG